MGIPNAIPRIPEGPLSVDVAFKARPSEPLCQSPSPEGTIGQAILAPIYNEEQHATWTALFSRQSDILEGRVCDEYREARERLVLPATRVPHLAEVSARLEAGSAWRTIRVGGYVPEPIFFKLLANRCFPCTDFLRHPDELEYTPAPDMFHDIMGHIPLFLNPRFASFFFQWGQAGLAAESPEQVAWLGRIYWFTVEFGLINPTAHAGAARDPSACRIYGAGIASSVGEILHSLSDAVAKRPFDINEIALREFDIHHMQDTLFEISSFSELEEEFVRWAVGKKLLHPDSNGAREAALGNALRA